MFRPILRPQQQRAGPVPAFAPAPLRRRETTMTPNGRQRAPGAPQRPNSAPQGSKRTAFFAFAQEDLRATGRRGSLVFTAAEDKDVTVTPKAGGKMRSTGVCSGGPGSGSRTVAGRGRTGLGSGSSAGQAQVQVHARTHQVQPQAQGQARARAQVQARGGANPAKNRLEQFR